ncbi:MAG TPA: heavy metal translocating P-type ATPase [Burkholderiaceae bacterium]|nr:heavy metal translocating P-type ATPase [Burkholderiaceae bacterium]
MEPKTSHAAASAGHAAHCCGGHDRVPADTAPAASAHPGTDAGTTRFRIARMDCTAEEAEIRRALAPIAGLLSLRFDLGQRTLAVAGTAEAIEAAAQAIRRVGFDPQPVAAAGHASQGGSGLRRLGAALLLALGAEALAWFTPAAPAFQSATLALAVAAIALAGLDTYKKGLRATWAGRLNINALMTVAVTGAVLIGQWPEAAMVMALYALAEWIEARAVDRARHAITGLLALTPDETEVQQTDGTWLRLATQAVPVGAIARIRPGERVPLDGTVTVGRSAVNQAPVTGESMPVDKAAGDPVYAGTINQAAALEFRVTAPATDSTLARIIHAVEHAQGTRAPTQRFVERFAAVYTPAVFVLAVALVVLAPGLAGWTWMQAVYKALVLLVIACPCALVISTPVTVVSGLAAAARRGILIKGGVFLERARHIKAVALDKTGTLTAGRPQLVAFEPVSADADVARLTRWTRSLAARSDHPVSQAIAAGLEGPLAEVSEFAAAPGCGVQGRIDTTECVLGNSRWIQAQAPFPPALHARLKAHEDAGRTVALLATGGEVLAICAVADTLKPSSAAAVSALKALGVRPVMLTGDNFATAQAIAAQAGIAELHAQLMPEEKLGALQDLQTRLGLTAMAGDGINDAPALAQADIGFAMGAAGTHTAMEAADIVIMNDDLQRLPETLRLSRRTHHVLVQNIAIALGIKAVFLGLAVFGTASMWMAVFADMGASLLVVFNGLRLLRGAQGVVQAARQLQ